MREIVLKVDNLHIYYKNAKRVSIKKTGINFNKNDYFHCIKGISFEVSKGQIIGIFGENGCGKSTLLKSIAGIFSADKGKINLYNNSISLLSIGVGFQKKLTGYENILLSGLLLGFKKEKILAKIDEIIEFSELGDFIYKPVNVYSSGMYSRLSFSITAVLETSILLIDEVLSVGDNKFKAKSYNKMRELIKDKDRTVLIVSHDMSTLKEICDKLLWLSEGKIKMYDKTETVIEKYIKTV